MATTAVSRFRHFTISTLLVAVSIAMGVALFRIWEVKQEVDAFSTKLNLDYGPQTTLIYDSKGRVISSLYKEHRIPVMLEQMSDPLVKAVIATEDKRFYEHNGVDLKRISAAWLANLRRGRIVQGASTIQ